MDNIREEIKNKCVSILEECGSSWKEENKKLSDEFSKEFEEHLIDISEYIQFVEEKKRFAEMMVYQKGMNEIIHTVFDSEDSRGEHYQEYQNFFKESMSKISKILSGVVNQYHYHEEVGDFVNMIEKFLDTLETR